MYRVGRWSRDLASGAALGTPSSPRSSSDGKAPFFRYHLPLSPKLAGSTLGLNNLIPTPKTQTKPTKREDRGRESRTESVYFHAQASTDLADSSTRGQRGKAIEDEARPCARQAARARPAGGSVQEQERGGSGRQKLEAPGGALARRKRERQRGQLAGQRWGYDCTLSTWAERWWCQSRRRV